jgi:protocatechuate 3,4-dioxygenase beta subunit
MIAKATNRRQMLRVLAGASLIPLVGCGGSQSNGGAAGAAGTAGSGGGAGSGNTTCDEIPEETGGPYPGDGTNGPNALTQSGIVRSDITTSFGALSGTAAGVALDLELTLVNVDAGCAPLSGYAIYLWHCDQDGLYSLYTIANQNYLRGVQETDANGNVSFQTIFPGAYLGRWPHIHFEMFSSLAGATSASGKVATSQLALPEDACNLAYAVAGYEQSAQNMPQTTLSSDNVFNDGVSAQMATVSGSASTGFVAKLTIALSV